ncbi:hypothetical protein EV182_006732, partial [Spiromyces aspiralis]
DQNPAKKAATKPSNEKENVPFARPQAVAKSARKGGTTRPAEAHDGQHSSTKDKQKLNSSATAIPASTPQPRWALSEKTLEFQASTPLNRHTATPKSTLASRDRVLLELSPISAADGAPPLITDLSDTFLENSLDLNRSPPSKKPVPFLDTLSPSAMATAAGSPKTRRITLNPGVANDPLDPFGFGVGEIVYRQQRRITRDQGSPLLNSPTRPIPV